MGALPARSRLREHRSDSQVPALLELALRVRRPEPTNKLVMERETCPKGSMQGNVRVLQLGKDSLSSRDGCHQARCSEGTVTEEPGDQHPRQEDNIGNSLGMETEGGREGGHS